MSRLCFGTILWRCDDFGPGGIGHDILRSDAAQPGFGLYVRYAHECGGHVRHGGVIYRMSRGHGQAASMLRMGFVSSRSILAKASTCIYLLSVFHLSFCSNGPAPAGRAIEASFGAMPTTSRAA